MKVAAITVRAGNVLEEGGKLWVVLKSEIFNPGKGALCRSFNVAVRLPEVITSTKAGTGTPNDDRRTTAIGVGCA